MSLLFDAIMTRKSTRRKAQQTNFKLSKLQLLLISTALMIVGGFIDYQFKDMKHLSDFINHQNQNNIKSNKQSDKILQIPELFKMQCLV